MQQAERLQIDLALRKIPSQRWDTFLASQEGEPLRLHLDSVRDTLYACDIKVANRSGRPISELIDLLGYRLLSDSHAGEWLRRELLKALSVKKWRKLKQIYIELAGKNSSPLHGNMSQNGAASDAMAGYWHQGSHWSRSFCEVVGLPPLLATRRQRSLPDDEQVIPASPLPPLHEFQSDVYPILRQTLRHGLGTASMLSLPTGAGKTRTIVEAICDHLAEHALSIGDRNLVFWIAQSNELLEQAWECFREVWQVPPLRKPEGVRRVGPLRVVRLWGGRKPQSVEFLDDPTVFIAGIDQLNSWIDRHPEFFTRFPTSRLACVVLDEAHSLITGEVRNVLVALQLRAEKAWSPVEGSAPVFGLTATPWRSSDSESNSLRQYFSRDLLVPESLGTNPITGLQRLQILANVRAESLHVRDSPRMSVAEVAQFNTFNEIPGGYLERLGLHAGRNADIVRRLIDLSIDSKALIFACSIAHAELLAVALNRATDGVSAAVVTSKTGRAERSAVIQRFRTDGGLRFLCNVGVLATGFDAPRIDVVCVTRPTKSALRYEQMVGRGLRGPMNGGTEECVVLDVQDDGLPDDIMSYARVAKLWDLTLHD